MQPQPQSPAPSPPSGNLLIFFLLAFLVLVGFQQIRTYLSPPIPKAEETPGEAKPNNEKSTYRLPVLTKPTVEPSLLVLGDESTTMRVVFDPRGAGVRRVTLNRFRAADEDGRPTSEPLDVVPASSNTDEPAYLIYHHDHSEAKRPVETLGTVNWQTAGVVTEEVDGQPCQVVRFTATVGGLRYIKTYSLAPGDYHLGLEVKIEKPAESKGKSRVRYQLAGARGLPTEGKWFASRFRNSLIALEDQRGSIDRDLQELQKIVLWGNGNSIGNTDRSFIRYAAIECQYFASAIVVANDQPVGQDRGFLASARPTLESGVIHGRIKSVTKDRITIVTHDGRMTETVYLTPGDEGRWQGLGERSGPVAILYRNLGYDSELGQAPKVALEVRTGQAAESTHALWEDDITIRVNTKPFDLEAGQSVTHRYLLYNGPVKPSLLKHLGGEARVDPKLLSFYVDDLKLNTMTDYQSPGWFGYFWYMTGITWLVIHITNLIHFLLGHLYFWVPNLGLCIILLTVIVRGLMYPLSRKQAVMGLKMQALAPEMKKLQEQYKEDKQGLQVAQWNLFKKHGVNPLGSCWVLFLQMPIFMGLWYALQESITFRLAPFWPTWVVNLAAPDMVWEWGRNIPIISADSSYGGFLYLGPYFNILPIIAVALMMVQQQMMTPPPTDEQQEMQQKMMKYMMVFFGLMFYKVAAGLCVYYIATTLWGFAERAMLPKATLVPAPVDVPAYSVSSSSDKITPSGSGAVMGGGKKNRKKRKDTREVEVPAPTPFGKWRQGWIDWWNNILEQARKK